MNKTLLQWRINCEQLFAVIKCRFKGHDPQTAYATFDICKRCRVLLEKK